MSDLKIICPFCNAPWTAKMKAGWEAYTECYDSGCGPTQVEAEVSIECGNCKREVYRKPFSGFSTGPIEEKDRL